MAHTASYSGVILSQIKWPMHEADRSFLSSAKVMIEWSCTSISYILVWCCVELNTDIISHSFREMSDRKLKFDVRKSLHHHTIQIIQPTRCNSFTSLLLDVYV